MAAIFLGMTGLHAICAFCDRPFFHMLFVSAGNNGSAIPVHVVDPGHSKAGEGAGGHVEY